MGALAPLPQWTAEDDLLLKNAVEAGASLESLAKGAVRFSRRFTIRELQDRWHSLLYDPEISEEASARMLDLEVDPSFSNHLKPAKPCSLRGKEWVPGKRKGDSVRSRYYAMRKRVCNVPYNSADLDFAVPPCTTIGFGGDMHLDGNCIMGASISDQFRIPESAFGIGHDSFPGLHEVKPYAANANKVHIVGTQTSDEIVGCNGSFGFGGNVPPVSDDMDMRNNINEAFEQKTEQKGDPHILAENLKAFESTSDVQDIGSPQKMSVRNPHDTNNAEVEPFPMFGSANDNKKHQEVSDGSGSLHSIGFSSPLVSMSIWGGIEGTSTLPIDASFDDNEQRSAPALTLPNDEAKKMIPAAYGDISAEQKLHDGMSGATLANPTSITEGDYMNLPLSFANDDGLFFFNEDGKDLIDASCLDTLNAIFSDSPTDIHHDNVYGSIEPKNLEMLDAHDAPSDGDCPGELRDLSEEIYSGFKDGHAIHDSVENVQDVPSETLSSSEPLEGFMVCNLNTEDTEIPYNDDVILPNEVVPPVPSTDLKLDSEVSGLVSLSSKIIADDRGGVEQDEETSVEPFVSSLNILSPVHTKVGLMHLSDDCRIKTEPSEIDSLCQGYRKPAIVSDGTNLHSSTPVAPCGSHTILKEEVATLAPGKFGEFSSPIHSLLEKSLEVPDHAKSNFQIKSGVCETVVDSAGTVQKWISLRAESGCRDREFADPSQLASTSDQEGKISDSEEDVPNFSDIEAMILDMDLGLSDQESSLFAREVSRYQYLDTKKAIMRLEQGAQSYMQRAIASHGAFAIFYGRRLKHYIRKPEVSLGRLTEDVYVDIDLKREGPANKISRRQAIIKMDEHGSFYLKNTGKCSILINGKEVLSGMQLNINSGCLIEIRGMKFIFEVNQNSVCHYLANVQRKIAKIKPVTSDLLQNEVL